MVEPNNQANNQHQAALQHQQQQPHQQQPNAQPEQQPRPQQIASEHIVQAGAQPLNNPDYATMLQILKNIGVHMPDHPSKRFLHGLYYKDKKRYSSMNILYLAETTLNLSTANGTLIHKELSKHVETYKSVPDQCGKSVARFSLEILNTMTAGSLAQALLEAQYSMVQDLASLRKASAAKLDGAEQMDEEMTESLRQQELFAMSHPQISKRLRMPSTGIKSKQRRQFAGRDLIGMGPVNIKDPSKAFDRAQLVWPRVTQFSAYQKLVNVAYQPQIKQIELVIETWITKITPAITDPIMIPFVVASPLEKVKPLITDEEEKFCSRRISVTMACEPFLSGRPSPAAANCFFLGHEGVPLRIDPSSNNRVNNMMLSALSRYSARAKLHRNNNRRAFYDDNHLKDVRLESFAWDASESNASCWCCHSIYNIACFQVWKCSMQHIICKNCHLSAVKYRRAGKKEMCILCQVDADVFRPIEAIRAPCDISAIEDSDGDEVAISDISNVQENLSRDEENLSDAPDSVKKAKRKELQVAIGLLAQELATHEVMRSFGQMNIAETERKQKVELMTAEIVEKMTHSAQSMANAVKTSPAKRPPHDPLSMAAAQQVMQLELANEEQKADVDMPDQ